MKHLRPIAIALACSPLCLAFHQPATKIAFAVDEGVTLKKVFTSQLELELDEMRILRNGQEPDGLPELEMRVVTDFEVVVEDEYLGLRSGASSKLRRTYDSIGMDMQMTMEMDLQGQTKTQDTEAPSNSKLEGKTVQFEWNAEDGEYHTSFVDEDGDKDLLEGLLEDMDLRAFLPDHEVEIGDEWTVEPHLIGAVLAPGGNLKLIPEDLGYDMGSMGGQMGELSDWFDENLGGKVTCRLSATRPQDEISVAVIQIEIKLENKVDLTEMAREELESVDLPPDTGELEVEHMLLELKIEGDGLLLWDLTNAHFHALDLTGDLEMNMDIGVNLVLPGFGAVSTEQQFDMSGDLTFGAEIQ